MNEYLISYAAFFIGSFAVWAFLAACFLGLEENNECESGSYFCDFIVLILVFWSLPQDTLVRLILYIPACVVFGRIWMGSKTIGKAASSVIAMRVTNPTILYSSNAGNVGPH